MPIFMEGHLFFPPLVPDWERCVLEAHVLTHGQSWKNDTEYLS